MQRALVLLSGGVGSAVSVALARQNHDLCALYVDFQQRAIDAEKTRFTQLCDRYQIDSRWTAQLSHFKQVGGHALIDSSLELPGTNSERGSSFVPMLMSAMIDVAVSFAVRVEAARVVVGACEQPLTIPGRTPEVAPDRRREFFTNYQYLLDSALPGTDAVTLETPLIDYDRSDIIKLGNRLEVPFDTTWSCFTPGPTPCGRCSGCIGRASSFLEAGMVDPLVLPAA